MKDLVSLLKSPLSSTALHKHNTSCVPILNTHFPVVVIIINYPNVLGNKKPASPHANLSGCRTVIFAYHIN